MTDTALSCIADCDIKFLTMAVLYLIIVIIIILSKGTIPRFQELYKVVWLMVKCTPHSHL